MKKHMYKIIIVFLVGILAVVSFYMLWVHVPYYQHHHGLDEIRNQICEENNYVYDDYFFEHHGQSVYYILRIKINGSSSYVAYDKDLNYVAMYQGQIADVQTIQEAILKRYPDDVTSEDIESLDVAYENNMFVYYVKIQNKKQLLYLYYHIDDGSFMKAIKIEKEA